MREREWSWIPLKKKPLLILCCTSHKKIEGKRRREWQRMRCLDGITNSTDMNLSKLCEIVEDTGAWCATVQLHAKSWTQLSD